VRLRFELHPDLPRLAWGARIRRGEGIVEILHGPWVETRDDCFFEGAWDGPFEDCRFDQAFTFAGSGAYLAGNGILFSTPSHTLEMIYSFRASDEIFVANSLAFVLALSGRRLDPNHRHYYLDFLDFNRAGIRMKDKRLRLDGPEFVNAHDCCNLLVGTDLQTKRIERPLAPPSVDYHSYTSYLLATAERIFANASHPNRKHTYRPVTCMSQGYDTTAVSAIAAQAGCREAVSFRRSNSKSGYEDDSGHEIAPYLGLHLTEYERTDYDRLPPTRDHEFYIEPKGVDRAMVLMERQLTGTLLLTGALGERMWNRAPRSRLGLPAYSGHPLFQLPTGFKLGGCALGEFRKKTGFLHLPLACSGGLHAPILKVISYSRGMDPWSVGGRYDRPIARRIAEEAGVPRHLFGQIKKGGPLVPRADRRSWISRSVYMMWKWTYRPPVRRLLLRVFGNRLNPAWRRGSFDVQRGVERMKQEYLDALATSGRSPVAMPRQSAAKVN
jgi:hypothetical protein